MKFRQEKWSLWMFVGLALALGSCDSNDREEAPEDSPKITTSAKRTSGTSTESAGDPKIRKFDLELEKFLGQSEFDELLSRFTSDYKTLSATQRHKFVTRIQRKITSENFTEAWSFLKTIPGTSGWVSGFRGAVLREAAKRGAVLPALHVLLEDYGPGYTRNHLLGDLFIGGGQHLDPKILNSAFEQLKFPDEISAAKKGLQAGLAFSEDIGNLEKFLQSENETFREIARDAVLRFPRAVKDPNPSGYIERLDQTLAFADKSTEIEREQVLENAVKHAYGANEAFAILGAIDSNSVDSQRLKLDPTWSSRLASQMISGNPERAIGVATEREDGGEFLGALVTAWIEQDVRAAFNWQNEARSGLSDLQQDQVSKSFAEKAIADNNAETAQDWIGQIADTDLRTNLQKRINEIPSE